MLARLAGGANPTSLRNPVKRSYQLSPIDTLHDTLFDPNQHYCQKERSCLGAICYRRPIARLANCCASNWIDPGNDC